MYNDDFRNTAINNLESKKVDTVNTAIALASQGYLVNKSKYIRIDWASILLNAFENMDIFDDKQQRNIELLYNRLSAL